jgi:hypothetical protein
LVLVGHGRARNPGLTNGTAVTREEAMAKFRAAWEKAGGKASLLI